MAEACCADSRPDDSAVECTADRRVRGASECRGLKPFAYEEWIYASVVARRGTAGTEADGCRKDCSTLENGHIRINIMNKHK